jgi:HEAT repeat protein
MDETRKAEAIAAGRREIARRIAKFCTSLSAEDFDRLLDRMAYVHWKYDIFPNVASLPEWEPETETTHS